jgi:hypothetical protein
MVCGAMKASWPLEIFHDLANSTHCVEGLKASIREKLTARRRTLVLPG